MVAFQTINDTNLRKSNLLSTQHPFRNFESLFKWLNAEIVDYYDMKSPTRIGDAREIIGASMEVRNPGKSYIFNDPRINRISYDYADKFWDFMISGGTDAEEAFKDYPNVAKFITKPKSEELPQNFNTFYGPRIVAQLDNVVEEFVRNPTTRRGVILILSEKDQLLLDKNESLEYPCTISFSFQLRQEELIMQTVMRSQNTAIVLQLDIYLQGRLLELMKYKLNERGIKVSSTAWQCYMQNAHVFERDIDYVRSFTGPNSSYE